MSKNNFKRNHLSIQQKIEIIERYDKGEKVKFLAEEFNSCKTTIYEVLRKRSKIEQISQESKENLSAKKRLTRRLKNPVLEEELMKWYNSTLEKNIFVTGPMIIKQALIINKQLGNLCKFRASHGWLDRFKQRNGLKLYRDVKNECTVDTSTAELQSNAMDYSPICTETNEAPIKYEFLDEYSQEILFADFFNNTFNHYEDSTCNVLCLKNEFITSLEDFKGIIIEN